MVAVAVAVVVAVAVAVVVAVAVGVGGAMNHANTKVDYDLLRKRMEEGLTNRQIADRTGYSFATVSKARRKLELEALVEVFNSPFVRKQAE